MHSLSQYFNMSKHTRLKLANRDLFDINVDRPFWPRKRMYGLKCWDKGDPIKVIFKSKKRKSGLSFNDLCILEFERGNVNSLIYFNDNIDKYKKAKDKRIAKEKLAHAVEKARKEEEDLINYNKALFDDFVNKNRNSSQFVGMDNPDFIY